MDPQGSAPGIFHDWSVMSMSYYFARTVNTLLVFEAVSLCQYVATIPYVDVNVLLLGPDSIRLSRVRGRVPSDPTECAFVRLP